MNRLFICLEKNYMDLVKKTVSDKHDEINPLFNDVELSELVFKSRLGFGDPRSISAHVQCIHTQLEKIYRAEYYKRDEVLREFSKSITLFDRLTGALCIEGGVIGDNSIASQNFYLDAVASCRNWVCNLYQGDMSFSCIPIKLRMAIEVYFKNMIGYKSSEQEILKGIKKGNIISYPLSIADLLRFFMDKKYKKYIEPPVDLRVVQNINYWSNHLVHTGVISFAWQNLQAIDLLEGLFQTRHKLDGRMNMNGFNYLSRNFNQKDLVEDLNIFLSNDKRKVFITCYEFSEKPVEGEFYFKKT